MARTPVAAALACLDTVFSAVDTVLVFTLAVVVDITPLATFKAPCNSAISLPNKPVTLRASLNESV